MSAEQSFRKWMTILVILFIAAFAYIVVADRHAPLTTEARVQSYVVQVAPEVTGVVKTVDVTNNQIVKKGDLLISVDPKKFELALEEAKLNLQAALDNEEMLKLRLSVAQARIAKAQASRDKFYAEYQRKETMHKRGLLSESSLDDARSSATIAEAELKAEQESLNVLQVELGLSEGVSTQVLFAINALEKAKLDLKNTRLLAPSDGVVTNLQVQIGTTAKINTPMLTFVSYEKMWVSADFREKSLIGLGTNTAALVTFDALPGQVYEFYYESRDFGVSTVQQNPDGKLTSVEANTRWVRDAQRARVHFHSSNDMPESLFVGSRATVTFYSEDEHFWQAMAKFQIAFFSWLHFVY